MSASDEQQPGPQAGKDLPSLPFNQQMKDLAVQIKDLSTQKTVSFKPFLSKRRTAVAIAVISSIAAVVSPPTTLWGWVQFLSAILLSGLNANKAIDSNPNDETSNPPPVPTASPILPNKVRPSSNEQS